MKLELIKFLSGKKNPTSRIDNEKELPYDVEKDLQLAFDLMYASRDSSLANSKNNSSWHSRLASRSVSCDRQK